MMMMRKVLLLLALMGFMGFGCVEARRIMLDTDMDTDDIFAILYLLKQNRSEVDLKAITVNANAWADAGHAVNQLYDILYMMGRDDIPVGVGGEGGILLNGTIQNDVGGYLPIIEQGLSTVGNCRYRQAVPIGFGGRLDVDTNYGLRRRFLPRGERRYTPLKQPTAQQVMIDTISAGPTTVFLTGAHTNFAIFLMKNPRLKKNIDRIFFMGGGIRSGNPTDSCTAEPSCTPRQCGDPGNVFTTKESNPYAEFNMFSDPFAAYKVLHSGIPITIVPLDATNTIPINKEFFKAFQQRQKTYEAQYCFRSLKTIRDNFSNDQFYTSYFMWDSFAAGILASTLQRGSKKNGENDFAEMEFLNITVVTSNKPYGTNDGSNPFFDGRAIPMFNLSKGGVHSGHVQTGIHDPFCMANGGNGKGRCKDGYTREVYGPGSVQVLVAKTAKRNKNPCSELNREFFENFLEVLNRPQQSGLFNFARQFSFYQEHLCLPKFSNRKLGKPVVLDMDMSPGDFLTLIYLLKLPVEKIDLKGILISGNGWANAASIDIVYDILHMMGRDDIPVGLGSLTPNEEPSSSCKYVRAIPNGSGGFLDTDTLFGLARNLPRGLRSYNREFSNMRNGFPKNGTELQPRQSSAMDVWQSISRDNRCDDARKITILANGPLTNLANIISSDTNAISLIQEVYIVGGHIAEDENENGNIFSIPSNKMSEFNFFLDPLAAKTVLESQLQITLVPLAAQRRVASFPLLLKSLQSRSRTPESTFARKLLHTMHYLQKKHRSYRHMDMFLGETLGAVLLANDSRFQASIRTKPVEVLVGDITSYGKIIIQENCGNQVKILDNFNTHEYYSHFTTLLAEKSQSAVIGSFDEQKRIWQKSDSFKVGN